MRASIAVVLLALAASRAAAAAPDPQALLQRAFDNYRARTSDARLVMTIHRPDWERRMEMTTVTRGREDALARFTAPASDAGSATLKLGRETWIYNPKLNQVIKLPASMMSRSWMGSDFTYDDLAKSETLITDFTHVLAGTATAGGHTVWTIRCLPKPGAAVVWGKVELELRDDDVVTGETFFDQDMKPARRMSVDRIGPLGGRVYPLSITMRPLDQPGRWTRVETTAARFDIALPAYVFTLSNLQNARP